MIREGIADGIMSAIDWRSITILYTSPNVATNIPAIDFAGAFSARIDDRMKVAREIHAACRQTGFFYIANHRVSQALIEGQFESAQRLFDLPLEEKLAIHMKKSKSSAGYEAIATQILYEGTPPDLKESFYCGMELADDHPRCRQGLRGFGYNQWPASLPGFKAQSLAYQGAMRDLGDRLLALSLELHEYFFVPLFDWPVTTLRMIRYPPHPAAARANQLGAGAHTDWGGITVLAQDDLGGLEVRNRAGVWLEARPIPHTFVINLGDLMQHLPLLH